MGKSCSPLKGTMSKVFKTISPKNIVRVLWNAQNGTRSKPMQFDVTEVDDATIFDALSGNVETALGRLGDVIGKINPETYKKLHANILASGKFNLALLGSKDLEGDNVEFDKGEMIKFKSIAIHELLSAMESESNIEGNLHVSEEDKINLLNNDGSRNLNLMGIRQTIGQKILGHIEENSFKVRGESEFASDFHARLGQVVLEQLEADGIIKMTDKDGKQRMGMVLNPSYVEDTETHDDFDKHITKSKKFLDNFPIVSIDFDAFLDKKDKGNADKADELKNIFESGELKTLKKISRTAHETVNGVAAVQRMVVPSNQKSPVLGDEVASVKAKDLGNRTSKDFKEMPPRQQKELEKLQKDLKQIDRALDLLNKFKRKTSEQKTKASSLASERTTTRKAIQELKRKYQGNGITQNHKELMNELSDKEARINPFVNDLMASLQEHLTEDIIGTDPEVTLRRALSDMGFKSTADQNMIFGIFGGSTNDDFKSKIGQSISKANPLLQLAMGFNNFVTDKSESKTFKQELEVYRTTRMGYLSTFLNEQMDKNFARAMTESAYAQEFNQDGELFVDMVATIQDQGMNVPMLVMQERGYHRGLDYAIDYILKHRDKDGRLPAEHAANVLKWARKGSFGPDGLKVPMAKDGPFSTASLLYAIADIRQSDGGTVKTHFRSKFDAAGSGIMLTAYQSIGKYIDNSANNGVYKLLENMGYIQSKDFDENEFNDRLENDEEGLVKDVYHILLNGLKKAAENHKEAKAALEIMKELEDMKIFKSLRDLVKPMTMITNYQAGDFTAVHGTAKELRESVIEHLVAKPNAKSVAYLKNKIKETDKEFFDKNDIGSKSAYGVANTVGVNAVIEQFFVSNLAENMREEIETSMLPMFAEYKKNVSGAFGLISRAFQSKIDTKDKDSITLGILPAIAKLTMDRHELKEYTAFEKGEFTKADKTRFQDFMKHHRKMLRKYSMPLTSKRQMVVHDKDGKPWTVVLAEEPNALTPSVNAIHGIDAAIFFLSHRDTINELKMLAEKGDKAAETALKNASGMIHDANNADIYYNNIYKKHYRKNAVEVNMEYDIEHELALTYASFEGKVNSFSTVESTKAIDRSLVNMKNKLDALMDVSKDTYRHFGFMGKENFDKVENIRIKELKKYDENTEPTTEDKSDYVDNEGDKVVTPYDDGAKPILYEITVAKARKAYMKLRNLLTNDGEYIIFDTETSGLVHGEPAPGNSKVNPSEVHEIALIKMKGNKEIERKVFVFDANDISTGAREAIFKQFKTNEEAATFMQKRFNEQKKSGEHGYKNNIEVMKAVEEYVGSNELLAYNAKFDYASLDIMQKRYGGNLSLNKKSAEENDLLAAAVYIKSNNGKEEINTSEGENTLENNYGVITKGTKQAWNSDEAHGALYDTKRTRDMVSFIGESINSGKLLSDTKDKKSRTKTHTEAEVKNMISKWKNEDTPLGRFLKKFDKVIVAMNSSYDQFNDILELTDNGDLTEEQVKQQLEHEVSHQKSVGFFGAFKDDVDVAYIKKNIAKLKERAEFLNDQISDPVIRGRMTKFLNEENPTRAALEFIAIMDAEPEVRDTMLKVIGNNSVTARIKRLIKKMTKWFNSNSAQDSFDFDQMVKSARDIVVKGDSLNEENVMTANKGRKNVAELLDSNKKLEHSKKKTPEQAQEQLDDQLRVRPNKAFKKENQKSGAAKDMPGFYQWNVINNESSKLVQRMLYNIEPYSDTWVDNADEWLEDNFDIYKTNKLKLKSIWDGNDTVESFKGYLNRPRLGRHDILNAFETVRMNSEQDAKEFRDTQITAMKRLIKKAKLDGKELTKEDIADLTRTTAKTAMFNLANTDGDLASIINADNHLDMIDTLIKDKKKTIRLKARVKHAEQLGLVLAGKLPAESAEYYNVEQMRIADDTDRNMIKELVSLYAMKHSVGTENGFEIMKQNKELRDSLVATSIALQELTLSVVGGTSDALSFSESLTHEFFENPKEFVVVNLAEVQSGKYPAKHGWKELRPAKGYDYGVMWRDRSKTTRQSGAGTTENYALYDLSVPRDTFSKLATNAVNIKTLQGTENSYHKVVLTEEELSTFNDRVLDPADVMIRAHAQVMMVKDTQSVRDYIMYKDLISVQKSDRVASEFDRSLKKMKVEKRPWFLKIPKGTSLNKYLEDNPRIALYYKIPDYASSVGDFNKSFDLVRKDLHDMILGYKDMELFEGDSVGRNIMFAIRQTVLMVKGHWIAQNPAKIANDIVSNNIILSMKGVPFKDMARNQTRAIKLSKEIGNLRSELIALEFEVLKAKHEGGDNLTTLEAKKKKLVAKIEGHEFAPLYKNGMIQSMSTEILKKDEAVVTGLQSDVEKIFNLALKKGNGDPSNIAKGVQWFADAGWSVDRLAVWLGESAENVKMFDGFVKDVGQNLKESGKRIQQKKKDKDMAKYLSEFVGSPDSELSRIGSYMVHMSDIAARYTLYKHLKNNPMKFDVAAGKDVTRSENDIVTEVLDTFVDYKVNMPRELKFLSDHGILLFPSFWMRIQKVMYVMAKEAPAKLGAGLLMHEALGISAASYYDSLITNKMGEIINIPPSISDPLDVVLPVDFLQDITSWM